jgi:tRNA-uridine 2-sulfurtransferase
MQKVIVGMSGGVDSSVTAYLLKKKGYDVEGVSFLFYETENCKGSLSCCASQATEEAAKTAHHIGIRHRTIDARNGFLQKVIDPFVGAYLKGITPNPCILCNRFIKFPLLIREADGRGAEFIATGHYARVEKMQNAKQNMQISDENPYCLKKGVDPKKDQSYVLYVLSQDQLKRLILPLGYYKKEEVRKMAKEFDLPSSGRTESQEICFIKGRNYHSFIEKHHPFAGKPGPIIDMNGKVIGTHKGIHGYTIGQRKGMGISFPEPLYVVKIDLQKNTIQAGLGKNARRREFFVHELTWIIPPIGGDGAQRNHRVSEEFRVSAKVRSTMKDAPATISFIAGPRLLPEGKEKGVSEKIVRVVFDKLQWAPAPGQSAVFYDEDIVIGGGVII